MQGNRSWLAFWPLVLLALMVRLGIGSLPLPQIAANDPLRQIGELSTLCDSQDNGHNNPDHHRPADLGDGALLLGEVLATITLTAGLGILFIFIQIRIRGFWCFPPVRGPPIQRLSGIFAQGPPD